MEDEHTVGAPRRMSPRKCVPLPILFKEAEGRPPGTLLPYFWESRVYGEESPTPSVEELMDSEVEEMEEDLGPARKCLRF